MEKNSIILDKIKELFPQHQAKIKKKFRTIHSEIYIIDLIDKTDLHRKILIKSCGLNKSIEVLNEYETMSFFYGNSKDKGISAPIPLGILPEDGLIAMEYIESKSLKQLLLQFKAINKDYLNNIIDSSAIALAKFHNIFKRPDNEEIIIDSPLLGKNINTVINNSNLLSRCNLQMRVKSYIDFAVHNILIESKNNSKIYLIDFPERECICTPHLDLAKFKFSLNILHQYPQFRFFGLNWWNVENIFKNFLNKYCEENNVALNKQDMELIKYFEQGYAIKLNTIYKNNKSNLNFYFEYIYLKNFIESSINQEIGGKMKILHVTKTFKPFWEFGGVARVSYEISKRLSDKGYEVTVFTVNGFSRTSTMEANKLIDVDGIKTYYLKNFIRYIPGNLEFISPFTIFKIFNKNRNGFDVIHLHELRTSLTVFVAYYAMIHKIPYVLHGHGSISRSISRERIKILFDVLLGYRIIKNASKLIAVSKEEGEHYKKMGAKNEKISVIYNGMDLEAFKNLPEYGIFRKKYGINGRMILYFGRIHKSKGIEFTIRGFSKLIEELDDVVLIIAGSDNGYKTELKKLIKELNISDKVKFTGFIDDKDKMSAYVDSDLFVHTVRYMGGVGLAPLEAILCNTPVIVTDECGEVIKEADCGYLVEYDDVNDLKEKMKSIIEAPKEGKETVERGRKYIEENLMWDKVMEKVEEVYK